MENSADNVQVDYNENDDEGSYTNNLLNASSVRKTKRSISAD